MHYQSYIWCPTPLPLCNCHIFPYLPPPILWINIICDIQNHIDFFIESIPNVSKGAWWLSGIRKQRSFKNSCHGLNANDNRIIKLIIIIINRIIKLSGTHLTIVVTPGCYSYSVDWIWIWRSAHQPTSTRTLLSSPQFLIIFSFHVSFIGPSVRVSSPPPHRHILISVRFS